MGRFSNTPKLGRFIRGSFNYENNLKPHSGDRRLKGNPVFIAAFKEIKCTDQRLLWHEYIENKKETTWKSELNWQLQLMSSGDRGKMCDEEKIF